MRKYRQVLRKLVGESLDTLKTLEALSLRRSTTYMAVPGNTPITIVVHHEITSAADHIVVVQAQQRRWRGLHTVKEVSGFVLTADGTRRSLTDEEKAPYL